MLPRGDRAREGQLAEWLADQSGELRLAGGGVERLELSRLHLVQRAALHEQALDRVKRRQLVVPRGHALDFGLDAEQPAEEVLQQRR